MAVEALFRWKRGDFDHVLRAKASAVDRQSCGHSDDATSSVMKNATIGKTRAANEIGNSSKMNECF